jgi:hypothetical protein
MYGETMGIFRIYTRDYQGHEEELFRLSGDQGNKWTRIIVPISGDKPFEVRPAWLRFTITLRFQNIKYVKIRDFLINSMESESLNSQFVKHFEPAVHRK